MEVTFLETVQAKIASEEFSFLVVLEIMNFWVHGGDFFLNTLS
jgi:hypothetical protein